MRLRWGCSALVFFHLVLLGLRKTKKPCPYITMYNNMEREKYQYLMLMQLVLPQWTKAKRIIHVIIEDKLKIFLPFGSPDELFG